MIPLSDHIATRRFPFVTVSLILVNALVYLWEMIVLNTGGDAALQQAILILLNNAADASPHDVQIAGRWDEDTLRLLVGDRGPGVDTAALGKLGRAFFTTKQAGKGTGMGLVLTASTLDRLGGKVTWTNRPEGGLAAEITLPLRGLLMTSEKK